LENESPSRRLLQFEERSREATGAVTGKAFVKHP
jgi:hypothetical protein